MVLWWKGICLSCGHSWFACLVGKVHKHPQSFPKLGKASNNIQSIKDFQVPIVHMAKSLVPHFNLLTSGQVTRDEI